MLMLIHFVHDHHHQVETAALKREEAETEAKELEVVKKELEVSLSFIGQSHFV